MSELINVAAGASYEELRAAQETLNAEIAKVASSARAEGLATVVKLINEFHFSSEDVSKALAGKAKRGPKTKTSKSETASNSTSRKAEPKYRNPADETQVWSGRGKAPLWIKDVEKDQRDAYLITPAQAPEVPTDTSMATESAETAPVATAPLFVS